MDFSSRSMFCISFIDIQYAEANCFLYLCKDLNINSDFVYGLEVNLKNFRSVPFFSFIGFGNLWLRWTWQVLKKMM